MQEFTEKDCMQTEKEASIQNRVVVLPSKVLPEHYTGAAFFLYEYPENRKSQTFHCPSGFLIYWGGMALLEQGCGWCAAARTVGGKRNDSSSPRSVHLGRWIYMDIPQNILDTVFCRMDAMRQGYGWQIQRKYGAM